MYVLIREGLRNLSGGIGSLGTRLERKTGLCGKNSQTGRGGLTQTHFVMSNYQVIFGMPK